MEADTIETERLVLTPLRTGDAEQMAEVLADPRLHLFIGGRERRWKRTPSRPNGWC